MVRFRHVQPDMVLGLTWQGGKSKVWMMVWSLSSYWLHAVLLGDRWQGNCLLYDHTPTCHGPGYEI